MVSLLSLLLGPIHQFSAIMSLIAAPGTHLGEAQQAQELPQEEHSHEQGQENEHHSANSATHSLRTSVSQQTQQQFACLYTKQKTQKRKTWLDGRLVVSRCGRVALHSANPPPGSGDPVLDQTELLRSETDALLQNNQCRTLELEQHWITIETLWTGRDPFLAGGSTTTTSMTDAGCSSSGSTFPSTSMAMRKVLTHKFRKPVSTLPPPPPTNHSSSAQQWNKRPRPLQPGELVRRYYPSTNSTSTTPPFAPPCDARTSSSTTTAAYTRNPHDRRGRPFEAPRFSEPIETPSTQYPQQHRQQWNNNASNHVTHPMHQQQHQQQQQQQYPPNPSSSTNYYSNHRHRPHPSQTLPPPLAHGIPPPQQQPSPSTAARTTRDTARTWPDAQQHSMANTDPSARSSLEWPLPPMASSVRPDVLVHPASKSAGHAQQTSCFVDNGFNATSFYGEDFEDEDNDEEGEENDLAASPHAFALATTSANECPVLTTSTDSSSPREAPKCPGPSAAANDQTTTRSSSQLLALFDVDVDTDAADWTNDGTTNKGDDFVLPLQDCSSEDDGSIESRRE